MKRIENKNIKLDKNGYLKNISDWNQSIAVFLAKSENIFLTEDHWKIINFIRYLYFNFNFLPKTRMLIAAISKQYGKKIGNSVYLYSLFPKGLQSQAIKIAGLPNLNNCF